VKAGDIKRGFDATKLRAAIFDALHVGTKKEKGALKPAEAETDTEEIAPI